jgi:hypothetical protein
VDSSTKSFNSVLFKPVRVQDFGSRLSAKLIWIVASLVDLLSRTVRITSVSIVWSQLLKALSISASTGSAALVTWVQ